MPHSSRREFLTGKAVHKEFRQVGDTVADELSQAILAPAGSDTLRLETQAMGCAWCVILNPGPSQQVRVASDAFEFVYRTEDLLTVYRDNSDVAKLNRSAFVKPHVVSTELFAFLVHCRELWLATQHTFDPTSGALIQLWKACRLDGRIPTQTEIDFALAHTGMQHLQLDSHTESISYAVKNLSLDFGAIGKGYAIDLATKHLQAEDVSNFLIHGGQSSLFAAGTHAALNGWPIGIKNPLFTEKRYATLLLKDQGMSTSGSNIQYFRHAGRRYGHILDPRTGWPAQGLLSVTVVAPTATQADAVSTAFYAMGLDNALRYCDDNPEVGAILIPQPTQGKTLEPVVRNIPNDRLFYESLTPGH